MTSFFPRIEEIALLLVMLITGCQTTIDPGSLPPGTVVFQDVTHAAGLGDFKHESGASGKKWFPEIMGAGVGFIDYNGDDWPDILLVQGGKLASDGEQNLSAVRLYRNDGGTFTDVTEAVGLATISAYGFGVAVADYDNDGDQDFALSTLHRNLLFRNNAGTFTEIGLAKDLPVNEAWSTALLFFDANQDGWVDLLVGNYVEWSPETDQRCTIDTINKEYCTPELYTGQSLKLYKNDNGQGFIDISKESGVGGNKGKTLGISMLDYNQDGMLDFVVANDTERDLLYENLGGGQFQERGLISGIALSRTGKASGGMGIDTGYIDGSGEPAIFIGNFAREMLSVFQHNEDGRFRDITTSSHIGRPSLLTLTFGLNLFDVDLDGDLDLFALNGHVHEGVTEAHQGVSFAQFPQLYLNEGQGKFTEHLPAFESAFTTPMVGRGAAYADIDHDGDLDLLLSTNNGPAKLWRNDTPGGHSLRITLTGSPGNKSALGARIEAITGIRRQIGYIKSGSSYLSASELSLTFGLGDSNAVDTLIVTWQEGARDTLIDVSAGQSVFLEEGLPGISRSKPFIAGSL